MSIAFLEMSNVNIIQVEQPFIKMGRPAFRTEEEKRLQRNRITAAYYRRNREKLLEKSRIYKKTHPRSNGRPVGRPRKNPDDYQV